jgi:phosphorylcholine metabolism protein LicD
MEKKLRLSLLLVIVLVLPSCAPLDWLKKKFTGGDTRDFVSVEKGGTLKGETLVTMSGKTIITVESLEDDFNRIMKENPQVAAMAQLIPDIKLNFLRGLVSQAVVDEWVKEHKIDMSEEYRKDLKQMDEQVRRMLNTKYFSLRHPVEISDAELKGFYEKNKDLMPDILVSRGGVETIGIEFDNEAAAQSFLDKVKGKGNDFVSIAEKEGLKEKVQEFKLVHAQSVGVPRQIKEVVVTVKKFPTIDLVKVDNKTFWVVNAKSKENSKYRTYDEVKASLRPYVEKEKKMEIFDKEIEKLKTRYNVVINEDCFKTKEGDEVEVEQEAIEKVAPSEDLTAQTGTEALPKAKVA